MANPEAPIQSPLRWLRWAALSRGVPLWAGFSVLIGLMLLMAADAERSIRRIQTTNAEIRREYRSRDDRLDRLRLDLYLSGITVRDYLLVAEPAGADARRRDLEAIRTRMREDLGRLGEGLPREETAPFEALRNDVAAYWSALEPALGWAHAVRRARAESFLGTEVVPRGRELLRLTRQLTAINGRQLDEGDARLAAVYDRFRQRLVLTGLITIGLAVAVAGLSISRILHLERVTQTRYQEVSQARQELRDLSARLVEAQEEERRRLSRELHDEIGQSMSALVVELGNLSAALPKDDSALLERVAVARRLAESSVHVVRDMSLLLRPSMLDDLGLVPALQWQAREVSRRTGLKVRVAAENVPDDLPDECRTTAYRVVQEALTNCVRHARAASARVTVRHDAGALHVSVQDDGIGFNPQQEKGMGLLGMEERVTRLGGVLHIDSEPGAGTLLSAILPLVTTEASKG
jgi:signal transduction histidine kinase